VSDRLADLQRQRALAQEQVAWFDREIAKETGRTAPVAPVPVPTAAPVASVLPRPTAAASDEATARAAQEIIAQYQASPLTAAKDVKKGCYLWFIFALGVLAICTVGVYFIYTHLR
jgi:hypothetical protein